MIEANNSFTFIDLFAGIGGFRVALENIGLKCVFSSEIDSHACENYERNFGENPKCDITKHNIKEIPSFDILCGGFPCQAFSIAGKKGGFNDTRGTLFFEIAKILKEKKPKAFILENVKHLLYHDGGITLQTILNTLSELGYTTTYKILNAKDFGTAQNRERIIIVGMIDLTFDFSLVIQQKTNQLLNILEQNIPHNYLPPSDYTCVAIPKKQASGLIFWGYLNKNIRAKGVKENTMHLSRTHKQPNRIYSYLGTHPTLSSQESGGRYYIWDGVGVRKLTVTECMSLMGFPKKLSITGSKTNIYKRIGNSVCVPMIEAVGVAVLECLTNK